MTILVFTIGIILIFEYFSPRKKGLSSFFQIEENAFWVLLNAFLMPFLISKFSWHFGQIFFKTFPAARAIAINSVGNLPVVVQFIIGLLLFDISKFYIHYLFHRIPFLWNYHKVHHAIEDLTVLTSYRLSWFEMAFYSFASSILLMVFGMSFSVVFALNSVSMAICLIQHANIKVPKNEIFERYLITPDNHRLHHAKKYTHQYGQNFGFLFNIWDRLHKTYLAPIANQEFEIGLEDKTFPKHYVQQFFYPFKKK